MTANTHPQTRIIVHAGPGLARYENSDALPDTADVTKALRQMAADLAPSLPSAELFGKDGSLLMMMPELMRSERTALVAVLQNFGRLRKMPNTLLTVVTFNGHVVQQLVSALVQFEVHLELAICLHHEDASQAPTVHRLSEDGYLLDWPYGILDNYMDEHELESIDFWQTGKRAA